MTNRLLDFLANLDLTRPVTRKDLFRAVTAILGSEIAEISDTEIEKGVRQLLPSADHSRPPGTVGPVEFFFLCSGPAGCRACGEACEEATGSKQVIRFVEESDPWWAGTPYVEPMKSACLLCEGFPCADACPSGALEAPQSIQGVSLGKAAIDAGRCVAGGENTCRACADQCPEKVKAISVDRNGWVSVSSYLCVGCGMCVKVCPMDPKAIVVMRWG